jgi:hypothetical protein
MKYKNLNGDSSVRSYTITYNAPKASKKGQAKPIPIPAAINVTFHNGATYVYTTASCGQSALSTMIQLAVSGAGLNSYIKRNQVAFAKKS